jgi:hypothetical protein
VNLHHGAAFDESTQPHPAVRPLQASSSQRSLVLALILGMLIGLALASLAGIGLYAIGWLGECPVSPTSPGACPPTAIYFLPDCPTNEAGCFVTSTPAETPTPEPTMAPAATPDFAATATQACWEWSSRFPGTPCPPLSTSTP